MKLTNPHAIKLKEVQVIKPNQFKLNMIFLICYSFFLVFNAVLQMCMFDLQPALLKFLKLPPGTSSKTMISKSKHWKKVKMTLRSYLTDLTRVNYFIIFFF